MKLISTALLSKRYAFILRVCGLLGIVWVVSAGSLANSASDGTENGRKLRLIELFTSHGCSSCPAADQLLGQLLKQDKKLLALEYHVDYWNTLVHGRDGNFVDPFSKSDYSMRQREYSVAGLAGRPGVYTPQAVVNGVSASVGSNRRHILKALSLGRVQSLQIAVVPSENTAESLLISISGSQEQRLELAGVNVLLVRYLDRAATQITGGENRHRELINHHIVIGMTQLGEVGVSEDMIYEIPRPTENEGCVILIQEAAMTPIYAAAECP